MRIIRVLRYSDTREPIPYSDLDKQGRHPDGTWKNGAYVREWRTRPWPFDVDSDAAVRSWVREHVDVVRRQGGRVQVFEIGKGKVEYFFQDAVKPLNEVQ